MEEPKTKEFQESFENDYQFILSCHFYTDAHGDENYYIAKKKRLLSIIEKYENIVSPYGKYSWLVAHAYFYLDRAPYRKGVIANFEKYLTLLPFKENYADTYIEVNHTSLIKRPKSKKEFIQAQKTHFKEIFYLLGKTCEKENLLQDAFKYIKMGMEIIPEEKLMFYWELYEVLRKMNNLPLFLEYCKDLTDKEKYGLHTLIERATNYIARGYVYSPRRH